jgi:hypothetical protein
MTTPLELAERCEREEPSRELDAEINKLWDGGPCFLPVAYSTSLDAAVAFAERALGGVVFWKIVRSSATRYVARVADDIGLAATPALALVSATLRALAARDGA